MRKQLIEAALPLDAINIDPEASPMIQLTIELPDQLAKQLNGYLQANPEATLAGLIDEALQIKLIPKDSSQLLALAGIVTDAPRGAADHAEDFMRHSSF